MSRRTERVNELLRESLSIILQRHTKDPRLGGIITITSVETSPDLRQAKVYISVLGEEEEKKGVLEGLRSAARFLRRSLAADLSLRHTPELLFLSDVSLEAGDRVLGLLRRVRETGPQDS